MKLKFISALCLFSTVFLASCSKDGEDGKTVLTRTSKVAAGANCTYGGTKFETGVDVNSNGTLEDSEVTSTQTSYVCDGAGALYSAWIDINVVANTSTLVGETDFDYKQSLPATAITADVVNKGVVLLYYKNINGFVAPVDRDDVYALQDSDAAGNPINVRTGFVYRTNTLSFLANGSTSEISVMNGNGSALRYVIIPGNNLARAEELKKLPYSEVAKLYNID